MIEPSGTLPQLLLDLLRTAGLPVVVVTAIGTAIAVAQWLTSIDNSGHAVEARSMATFRRAPRRVRAYALFVISHAVAVTLTIGLLMRLFADPAVIRALGTSEPDAMLKPTAVVALYFLVVDWWSLRQGDEVPAALASIVGVLGGAALLFYGAYVSAQTGDWAPMIAWFIGVAVWFRALTWATNRGSALARAIQS